MIVPEFKLKQTETHVQVFIRVPYIKVSACEFYIQPYTFKFYLKPYLLSLTFEQTLKEVEQPAKAVYYHDKYLLEVFLEKAHAGEHFQNLQMLASILNNKKPKKKSKINVEVIGQSGKGVVLQEENAECNHYNYGFSQNYSNVLDHLQEETMELFEFDPKLTPLKDRFQLSNQIIIQQFDYESYLFDKYENQQIQGVLGDGEFLQLIESRAKSFQSEGVNSTEFKLKMKGKELLISKRTKQNIFKEIISISFSYLYQLICMGGEMGPESARTINRTSLVLSCSSYYYDCEIKDILVDCVRRCLTFSLYKSMKIAWKVLFLLPKFLSLQYIIIIFLQIRELFEKNEPRYLLNKLFIDDYLIYLFSLSEVPVKLNQICKQIEKIKISEEELGFKIEQYQKMEEESGPQKIKEEKQEQKLVEEFSKLNTLD